MPALLALLAELSFLAMSSPASLCEHLTHQGYMQTEPNNYCIIDHDTVPQSRQLGASGRMRLLRTEGYGTGSCMKYIQRAYVVI